MDASTPSSPVVRKKITSGSKPVHIYSIATLDQVWCHNDNGGDFDVFHVANAVYRSVKGVKSSTLKVVLHINTLFFLPILLFIH